MSARISHANYKHEIDQSTKKRERGGMRAWGMMGMMG